MRSKFSQGMPHCRTAARWGWLGENRGPVLAWHNLGSARPFPKSFRERGCVSRGYVRMGCRNQLHPPGAGGLLAPGSGMAEAVGVTCACSAGHSCSTKARGLVPSSHCCPGGSGSAPLPPAWAGAILGPCSRFRVSALLPPGTRLFVLLQLRWGRREHPLLSRCATPPVSLQTSCFISSRCTLSAPATSPQKETPPPPGIRLKLAWPGEITQ